MYRQKLLQVNKKAFWLRILMQFAYTYSGSGNENQAIDKIRINEKKSSEKSDKKL